MVVNLLWFCCFVSNLILNDNEKARGRAKGKALLQLLLSPSLALWPVLLLA